MSIAYYAVLLTQLICFSGEALRRVQGSSDVNDPPGTSNSPSFFWRGRGAYKAEATYFPSICRQ